MDSERPAYHDDVVYPSAVPFILIHLACFAAIWTGVTWEAVALCITLYWLRIFAIGAGYHRYFSHRAYSTSRVFQFVLAFLAQSSAQKSVLWWASKHRHHHLHSDTEQDVHSPRHAGFIYSHLGWIFARKHDNPDYALVSDLMRYPELMWLHRLELVPPILLAVLCFLIAGWPGLIVGFLWSTVLVYHATFCINSLAHVVGRTRYVTGDDSRNNWLLAIFTMGEGWHNNHHAYQSSARQGFRPWEIDPTYYILKLSGARRRDLGREDAAGACPAQRAAARFQGRAPRRGAARRAVQCGPDRARYCLDRAQLRACDARGAAPHGGQACRHAAAASTDPRRARGQGPGLVREDAVLGRDHRQGARASARFGQRAAELSPWRSG